MNDDQIGIAWIHGLFGAETDWDVCADHVQRALDLPQARLALPGHGNAARLRKGITSGFDAAATALWRQLPAEQLLVDQSKRTRHVSLREFGEVGATSKLGHHGRVHAPLRRLACRCGGGAPRQPRTQRSRGRHRGLAHGLILGTLQWWNDRSSHRNTCGTKGLSFSFVRENERERGKRVARSDPLDFTSRFQLANSPRAADATEASP